MVDEYLRQMDKVYPAEEGRIRFVSMETKTACNSSTNIRSPFALQSGG